MANGNDDDRWCECGHLESDHRTGGCGACAEDLGCDCMRFKPAEDQDD